MLSIHPNTVDRSEPSPSHLAANPKVVIVVLCWLCNSILSGRMTARSRSPDRRQPRSSAMEADRSHPILVGPYRSTGIPDAIVRLPEMEIRITQDAVRGFPGSRVRIHRLNIHYGWTGSTWIGTLNLTLDPERGVEAFAAQAPPENVD